MRRLTYTDRACAVAAAAAHDLNNELTIIVNSACESILTLEPDHPALPFLSEIQDAARRCAFRASGLLHFSASHGIYPVSGSVERLTSDAERFTSEAES